MLPSHKMRIPFCNLARLADTRPQRLGFLALAVVCVARKTKSRAFIPDHGNISVEEAAIQHEIKRCIGSMERVITWLVVQSEPSCTFTQPHGTVWAQPHNYLASWYSVHIEASVPGLWNRPSKVAWNSLFTAQSGSNGELVTWLMAWWWWARVFLSGMCRGWAFSSILAAILPCSHVLRMNLCMDRQLSWWEKNLYYWTRTTGGQTVRCINSPTELSCY